MPPHHEPAIPMHLARLFTHARVCATIGTDQSVTWKGQVMHEFDIAYADTDDDVYEDTIGPSLNFPTDPWQSHAARRVDASTPELAVARYMAFRIGKIELADFLGQLDLDDLDKRYWTMVWREGRDTRMPFIDRSEPGFGLSPEESEGAYDILLSDDGVSGEPAPCVAGAIKAASPEIALAIFQAGALGDGVLRKSLEELDLDSLENEYIETLKRDGGDGRRLTAERRVTR